MVRVSARGPPVAKGLLKCSVSYRGAHGLLLLGRTSSLRGLPGFTVAYVGRRRGARAYPSLYGLTGRSAYPRIPGITGANFGDKYLRE
jgi:hypothetical protein